MFFEYGTREMEYLQSRDPKLGKWIAKIGHVARTRIPEIYPALVNAIAAQQISGRAFETVWSRILLRGIDHPENAVSDSMEGLGLSKRKICWIRQIAQRALAGELLTASFSGLSDEAAITRLTALAGVGRWTAEMLLIFCLNRMDVLSAGDFGIRKGVALLYGACADADFPRLRALYSPYASVASIYLWEIAGGKHGQV